MIRLLRQLRHAVCVLLGFVEITRRLPEVGFFRAPYATCGRCGRVLRCLLVVPPAPTLSAEARALMEAQARLASSAAWESRGQGGA